MQTRCLPHHRYPKLGRGASLLAVAAVYVAAVVIGLETAESLAIEHPVAFMLTADVVATLVVFAFSCWYGNASTYDPYWSVIPMLIVLHWAVTDVSGAAVPVRQWLVVGLVWAWGARLTWNWIERWQGLGDEDWRYVLLRSECGERYFLVNLFGIHLLPTLLVFAGVLASWPALADARNDLNWLDLLAAVVTFIAICLEESADRQLRRHRASGDAGRLQSGWWARSRHPNYFGEVLFWWGLYLFALAANPGWWWSGIGALAITVLFVTVSIPMMDRRMLKRDPAYQRVMDRLPAMIPKIR
ncbi:MAG: DUF1295 domain-containing protein [Xanthomonadales bacterium]|nr:DUF1295 domain-containing protein [Xanthomonadales bacterium]